MTTDLTELLTHYLNDPLAYPEADLAAIATHLALVSLPGGSQPIRAGSRHPYAYFLIAGLARSFYDKDGVEINTWFAGEEEVVGSLRTYQGRPARETIEFLEDSRCMRIDVPGLKQLARTNATAGHLIQAVLEEYAEFLEDKLHVLQYSQGLERYQYLLKHEPELLLRVSLTHLASYLGMTRETLSRLRAKITL